MNGYLKPTPSLGASYRDGSRKKGTCDFLVWAPRARNVDLCLKTPEARQIPMLPGPDGYFSVTLDSVEKNSLYQFRLAPRSEVQSDGGPVMRADPASRHQPHGVHGPSRIVPNDFSWNDSAWKGVDWSRYIIYELHVGTATPKGTFEGIIDLLPMLRDLGITALELMPVSEFPGSRNWGYDGVYPFAAHHAYGGPRGLKKLVDACHRAGLAVILDVVYNHLGPEGNYLDNFGPYFTDIYTTPWGRAVNFDGPDSDHVRRYFLENARYWIHDCHIDALRVDAVHGIYDFSARPFLAELTRMVRQEAQALQRHIYCIAESDLNDTKVIRPLQTGGLAFDAQWNDDFHHALHTLLTGERNGYYADFGRLDDLASAWRRSYVYDGRYSVARRRRHGNSARRHSPDRFVVFSQNHDQVGNRMGGERTSRLLTLEQLKLAAASVLLSPFIPLLFMGEEYAEPAPFAYFISHTDPDLVEAVRKGREREFEAFRWQGQPPDPQATATFAACRLSSALHRQPGRHQNLFDFYRELIALRKELPALAHLHRNGMRVDADDRTGMLRVRRRHGHSEVRMLFHFGSTLSGLAPFPKAGAWQKRLDSAEERWSGPGSHVPDAMGPAADGAVTLSPWQVVLWERIPDGRADPQRKATNPE